MLDREAWWQAAEPGAGAGHAGAPPELSAGGGDRAGEVEGAPGDGAAGRGRCGVPGVGAAGADDVAGILGGSVEVGVDDPEVGRARRPYGGVDRLDRRGASGVVVVEGQHDALDAVIGEALEEAAANRRAAECDDGADAVGAQDGDVHDALDERQLRAVGLRCRGEEIGHSVGQCADARFAAQVEVALVRAVVDGARPERHDAASLVAPGADDPAGPAGVSEEPGGRDLVVAVAGACEREPQSVGGWDDAEHGVADAVGRDAAVLEVVACGRAALAGEFAAGEDEGVVEQVGLAFGLGRGSVESLGVDPGSFGELADGVDEVAAAGGLAVVDVGRPEHRALAVDEEAARRVAVADDAVRAGAEGGVGELLVGGVPAARIGLPGELRERGVEPLLEGGQHLALVEVGDADAFGGCHDLSPFG